MAEVFAGSARIPSELMRWPTNSIDALLNSHFSELSVTLFSLSRFSMAASLELCSS